MSSVLIEEVEDPGEVLYTFEHIPSGTWKAFDNKDLKDYFQKWNIDVSTHVSFSYDKAAKHFQMDAFIQQLFNSPAVQAVFQGRTKEGHVPFGNVSKIDKVQLSTRVTSMTFFDDLKDNREIIRANGSISKRLEDVYQGVQINDHLREALLQEDSELWDAFPDNERNELIFRVFKALVLGGSMCQYEDSLEPYLKTTKLVYKDLVSVQKANDGTGLEVTSWVYEVTGIDATSLGSNSLFPIGPSPANFCYVAVDPIKRVVHIWYHAWVSYW